jgi:hypothetical protein
MKAADDTGDNFLDPSERLTRDLKKAAETLTHAEARYLVDAYYMVQHDRIRGGNQVRALNESEEPHQLVEWFGAQSARMEANIQRALDVYTNAHIESVWAKSICGIGPVLAAGLAAHIDITKAPTVGHIWTFGGYNPTSLWSKGEKRPWNARLKTLFWKCGESFVKVSGNKHDTYGKVYLARKAYEHEKNLNGDYREQAEAWVKRVGKETIAYKSYSIGKLPDGHLHARAKRYAVKLFLSGYHEASYFAHYGTLPPKPYVIEHLGHVHYIAPPNTEVVPGWAEARAAAGI